MFTEFDGHLFHEGTLYDVYKKMGAHPCEEEGVRGVRFTLWAEHAKSVDVVIFGVTTAAMKRGNGAVWEAFVPGIEKGAIYKYRLIDSDGKERWKADPYAFYSQLRPDNASVVWGLNDFEWTDEEFIRSNRTECIGEPDIKYEEYREEVEKSPDEIKAEEAALLEEAKKKAEKLRTKNAKEEALKNIPEVAKTKIVTRRHYFKTPSQLSAEASRAKPMSIYEVHLGSWKKDFRLNSNGFINYRRLADELSEYVTYMGYTHVEVMGICEYPFDGSWGYQVTGYFSPSSRHGEPEDLKYFINKMHSCGIGVIIDWVPAHFPKDAFGLEHFDGTAMYESSDPLLAEYPEWGTMAFDHSKPEVRNFLISSAFYWIREFHADALRVDAVAAMLYTNFSRAQWRPNKYGGTRNLESVAFLQQLNREIVDRTGAFLIAEDSSEEQGITKSVYEGGIGFMYKWNMGWMNDTLRYFKKEPVYRKYHFHEITHTVDYVFTEYFVNVLSHDEVVHLKKSMFGKMPGIQGDQLSGLKSLYTYQFTHPGKKLLFMGQEFAQEREWDENREIDWFLASDQWHRDVMMTVRNLLHIYKENRVLYDDSEKDKIFEWVNSADYQRGILAYIRKNPDNYDDALLVVINTTPVQYSGYSCGAPKAGMYQRIFSTYDTTPGTENIGSEQAPPLIAKRSKCDGFNYRLTYDLRPNEAIIVRFPVKK
ncbi:MAG: 1,4-alpha-glucan branching protein GlgB [Parasporobacterium sp.]|nr:1,4-alpha-glucan branching protein GlgB [Parasporobacterium sp.]